MKTMLNEGMSPDQHRKLGSAMRAFEAEIAQTINRHHYKDRHPQQKALFKLMKVLAEARNVFDNAAFDEHPALETKELTSLYYGGRAEV